MNLIEFYKEVGGDYATISANLKDELIYRLLKMFLDDKSFSELQKGIEEKDAELAFRGIHSLKGVSLNLGLNDLAEASSKLTEDLRGRKLENYLDNYALVIDEYNKVINTIKQLD